MNTSAAIEWPFPREWCTENVGGITVSINATFAWCVIHVMTRTERCQHTTLRLHTHKNVHCSVYSFSFPKSKWKMKNEKYVRTSDTQSKKLRNTRKISIISMVFFLNSAQSHTFVECSLFFLNLYKKTARQIHCLFFCIHKATQMKKAPNKSKTQVLLECAVSFGVQSQRRLNIDNFFNFQKMKIQIDFRIEKEGSDFCADTTEWQLSLRPSKILIKTPDLLQCHVSQLLT